MYIPWQWYVVYTYVHEITCRTNFKKITKISHYKKEAQKMHKREVQVAGKKEEEIEKLKAKHLL